MLAELGLAPGRSAPTGVAQAATPGTDPDLADAQARLDALDADTRDSLARALWTTELRAEDFTAEQLSAVLSDKNSNAAFGQRMGLQLIELAVSPPSFVPDAADRYAAFYPYCSSLSAHQAYAMRGLLGPQQSQGYLAMPEQADLVFPQADAMQLDAQLGWYFFVGSCTDVDGNEYGVELMFFGGGLLPPALAAQAGLSDLENQVFEMHFAVAKAGERHYQAKPIVLAGTSGLLSFEADGLGAAMGKNVIRSLDAENVFPVQIQAWGQDDGAAEPVQLAIDLTFASGKDYLLQGDEGCTPCCDGPGTLYYSIPNLQIDPVLSTLTLNGGTITLASGVFWFDHQWGMLNGVAKSAVVRAVNSLQAPGPGGWDWFASEKSLAPLEYPPTGTWYPNRWEFAFGDGVPDEIRAFSMTPIVSGGQSGFFASGAQYSEGAVYLRNAAGEDIGRGFAESVQYADTLTNQIRIARLPVNDEMLSLLQNNEPSEALKLISEAYIALHLDELQQITATCRGLELTETG